MSVDLIRWGLRVSHHDEAVVRVLHSRKAPLTGLRQRMRELAQTRVRFGYRRLLVLMRREGWDVGKERFYRVYTEGPATETRPLPATESRSEP